MLEFSLLFCIRITNTTLTHKNKTNKQRCSCFSVLLQHEQLPMLSAHWSDFQDAFLWRPFEAFGVEASLQVLQVSKSAKNQETQAKSCAYDLHTRWLCYGLFLSVGLVEAEGSTNEESFSLLCWWLCCNVVVVWWWCNVWNGNWRQPLIRIN